jgi:SnoaL-like domain
MTSTKLQHSRRTFFLQGSAALGAGVATAVSATEPDHSQPTSMDAQRLAQLQDHEAIRQLQLAYAGLMERQNYAAAAELFGSHANLQLSGACATGEQAIRELLTEQYRHQSVPTLHCAYRPNGLQSLDALTVSADGTQATATLHVDVAVGTALQGASTIAQMARQQGQLADRRWESGIIDAQYVKSRGTWKIASLRYPTS